MIGWKQCVALLYTVDGIAMREGIAQDIGKTRGILNIFYMNNCGIPLFLIHYLETKTVNRN